jgi:hypothetical protein
MKQTPLSSPGLTGRPSIPQTPAIESRSRGVLDRPVKPGDDRFVMAARASSPGFLLASLAPASTNSKLWQHVAAPEAGLYASRSRSQSIGYGNPSSWVTAAIRGFQ